MDENKYPFSLLKKFPLIEGICLFIGIVGWNLLCDGKIELLNAALISAVFSFLWFIFRICHKIFTDKKNLDNQSKQG